MNVSLPHSENASCPLSAFPTFRIFKIGHKLPPNASVILPRH